jgi:hypothetical protein
MQPIPLTTARTVLGLIPVFIWQAVKVGANGYAVMVNLLF